MAYAIIKGTSIQGNFPEPDKSQEITGITVHGVGKNLLEASCISGENITIKNGESRVCFGKNPYSYYEEKERVNMDKFLDLKETEEYNQLETESKEKIQEIKEEDKIVKIMKETKARIEELDKDFNLKYFPTFDYITKETDEKINKVYGEQQNKRNAITKKYKEIRALCEGANHTERMEIYKMYGLIEG